MAPLRVFLDSERLQRLSSQSISELTKCVAESVASRYQQLAEELLTTVSVLRVPVQIVFY